jgi:serine/threonine protein kinase
LASRSGAPSFVTLEPAAITTGPSSGPLSAPSLRAGVTLDARFRLLAPIGRGGFGDVWRAEELLPNGAPIREVALKLLAPETDVAAWAEEAKLLASFSHPSLVTILAAGLLRERDSRVPFVAMELLEGETLASVHARRGAQPWRRVLAWARDVAAALDVIHARGVVHLDLKPSNLFLSRDGSLKVLDFGIARRAGAAHTVPHALAVDMTPARGVDLMPTDEFVAEHLGTGFDREPLPAMTRAAPVIGTPGFMAPEVIEDRPATAATDAYALAACVIFLTTGALPQDVPEAPVSAELVDRRAFLADVRHATLAGRLKDLASLGLPRGLTALLRRWLALDPSERDVTPGELGAAVDAVWARPYGVPSPPYLGLGAFGPHAEGLLFGRDDDVARLVRELQSRVALVLQGVSGSGKSSLAMAGLVPALGRRDARTGPDWRAIVLRPGATPDLSLEALLVELDPSLSGASAKDLAAFARKRGEGLVVIVDQLEELVTQPSPEDRPRFVALLAELAALPIDAPVRLVGTLREDFTTQLFAIPNEAAAEPTTLGDALRDALRFIGPPTMAAVREIVERPAVLAGARVEGLGEVAADVERELRAGEGRLPLVALALTEWWHARETAREATDGAVLSAEAWRRLGGVRTLFASLADGVFALLDEAAQGEARALLLELTLDGRTRRSRSREWLGYRARDKAAFERALSAFLEAKLLVATGGAIDVVHEFLFTAWDRLGGWLADAQAQRRLATALAESARTWNDLARPPSRLPSREEAALIGLVLEERRLDDADAEIVRAWGHAAAAVTRGRRARLVSLAVIAIGFVAAGLAAWGKTVSDAQEQATRAQRKADETRLHAEEVEHKAQLAEDAARRATAELATMSEKNKGNALAAEEFKRELAAATNDAQRARLKCNVLAKRQEIDANACPPNDPLCTTKLETTPPKR